MSDNESVPDPEASRAEPEVEGGDAGQETAAGSGQETATVSSGIIHLSDNAKLDIIEKIDDEYKVFLGDVKASAVGREKQAIAWKNLRDYVEKEYKAVYVSGKKLRDAFRQWRFRLDKKVKGKSLTGRGKITLSKVETAILDMQTRHSKRYNTTLVHEVPDTGARSSTAGKKTPAKKTTLPESETASQTGPGLSEETLAETTGNMSARSLVKVLAKSKAPKPTCATPPRPRLPSSADGPPTSTPSATLPRSQDSVASNVPVAKASDKRTGIEPEEQQQHCEKDDWKRLRMEALKMQIRKDKAIAVYYEKLAAQLPQGSGPPQPSSPAAPPPPPPLMATGSQEQSGTAFLFDPNLNEHNHELNFDEF